MLNPVLKRINESQYDNWEWVLAVASATVSTCIIGNVQPVTTFLHSLDHAMLTQEYAVREIAMTAMEGVVMGLIGAGVYSKGNKFSGVSKRSNSKLTVFVNRLMIITVVGVVVGLIIPDIIRDAAEFVVLQTLGGVLLFGYVLIHREVFHWDIENEMPVLLAGLCLAVVPFL